MATAIATAASPAPIRRGWRNPSTAIGRDAARRATIAGADAAYVTLAPLIFSLRRQGQTLEDIAARLNADGHVTRRGAAFSKIQVYRILGRPALAGC